ncbi:hypothetical protein JHK82_056100 [Glycine max]|nr:hypothetical protein JHK86_055926 [Glycine max]KAG5077405.1 hypothetical protein JHK82_056100 [Glycine max]
MTLTNAFLAPSFAVHGGRVSDPRSIPLFSLPSNAFFRSPTSLSRDKNILYASAYDLNAVGSASLQSGDNPDSLPMPIVLIDQESDSEATIVQLSFGNRLGALLDTVDESIKRFGIGCFKGNCLHRGISQANKIFHYTIEDHPFNSQWIAPCSYRVLEKNFPQVQSLERFPGDTGRKVEDPDMLERIRLTIINNLLKYHPESSELLAMGEVFGIKAPKKKLDDDIKTRIQVKEDGPKRSLLYIETADRPGLLVEIIKVIADVNIDVESAEIDTEGLVAKDTFHVSYGGAALNSSMSQVLVNCLRYYLRTPETDIDSY